ncbi:MAG: hypothetical protein ACKVT0_07535 [Planctomycetaceae bacterium]
MNRRAIVLSICLLCIISSTAWARIWTDIQGQTMAGSYKAFNKTTGMVTITLNGRRIPVPFSQLCREDRDFVIDELKKKGRDKDVAKFDTPIPDPSEVQNAFQNGGRPGQPNQDVAAGLDAGKAGMVNRPGAGVGMPGGQPFGLPQPGAFPTQPGMPAGAGPMAGRPGMSSNFSGANAARESAHADWMANMERQQREREERRLASEQQSREWQTQLKESQAMHAAQNEARQERHRNFNEALKGIRTFEHQLVCDGCNTVFDKEKYKAGDLCPHCNPPSAQANAGPTNAYTSTPAYSSSDQSTSSSSSSSSGWNRSQGRAIGKIIALVVAAIGGIIGLVRRMGD